tara:strand:- start:659 stop:1528 length:870 start_codon:yes stop_codon:yes gene_type:complete
MYIVFLFVLLLVLIWYSPMHWWARAGEPLKFKTSFLKQSLVQRGKGAWSWIQSGEGEWPNYKFYGDLLRELQRLSKLYGATPKASLERIKRPLLQDIRFETKMREIRLSGLSQFLAMALMTWSFMILSRLILSREFDATLLLFIGALQLIGVVLYLGLEALVKDKVFKGYDSAYEGLVALQALLPLGLSLKEKRDKSGIDHFLAKKELSADLERVRRQLQVALAQWKEFGRPLEQVLADCLDDIRFAQELAQERLIKRMNGLKFLIAAVFFLSAYLLDLLALVNSFFIE